MANPLDSPFANQAFTGLDLDLSSLDMTPLREAVNPAPVERVPTTASTSGLSVQDFGAQPKFESPDESLANYGDVYNTLKSQEEQVNKVYNYNNFDPSDFGRSSVSLQEGSRAAGTGLAEYVQQNEIPLFKIIDGKKQYLTTGNNQANQELWKDGFVGGYLVATGPVGTYSTTFQKNDNILEAVSKDPILGLAATFIPGGSLAMTALKAGTGQSLSPADLLTVALPALETTGLLKAPVDAAAATKAGSGLAGLSYNNTVGLLSAAATGNPTSFVTSYLGNAALDKAFTGVEGADKIAGVFQADDLRTGLNRVVEKVSTGSSFKDAIVSGLGAYVKEGGGLSLPNAPDIDLGVLEDVVRAAVKPIEGIVRAAGSVVDDGLLQPIKEFAEETGEILKPALEEVREGGRAFDDEVIQPVREAGQAIDDAVIQPAGEALSALDTALRDIMPSFDLNIPNLNPALGTTQLNYSAPSYTRTTDSLFKDELFKFQTEIGVDVEPTDYVDLNYSDPFQEQTLLQRYPF